MKKISIIGATGHIGQKVMDEAILRGHCVTAIVRDKSKLSSREQLAIVTGDTGRVEGLTEALRPSDVVIFSVKWNENSIDSTIEAVRNARVSRAIFVIGAGSLSMPDGRLWFDHMADRGILPPTSKFALEAYGRLRNERVIDWAAFSPAAEIDHGERTGVFRVGRNELILDPDGESRISTEDFAVAILNEIETPTVSRSRLTVGY